MMKKEGYTKIPNKMFDYILTADLKPLELKLLLLIIRKTVGYNRDIFRGGYGKVAKQLSNSARSKTFVALNSLVKRGILQIRVTGTKNHTPNIFVISTNVNDWVLQLYPLTSPLQGTSPLGGTTSSPLQGYSTSPLQGTSSPQISTSTNASQDPTLQYIHNNNINTVNTPKHFLNSARPQSQNLNQLSPDLKNLLKSSSKNKFNLPPNTPDVVIPDFTF